MKQEKEKYKEQVMNSRIIEYLIVYLESSKKRCNYSIIPWPR